MTNYEKIKVACIKANPKLMELSFGCEVMASVDLQGAITPSKVTIKQTIYDVDSFDGIPRYHGKGVQYSSFWRADIKEILGHEPQLSDVLLVIEKLYWSNEFANEAGYDWYVRQLLKRYNLANPLKDQSEETLKCITNLYEELQKIASLHNPL